jgi:hypothetical protein
MVDHKRSDPEGRDVSKPQAVDVDFNDLTADGRVYVGTRARLRPLMVGQRVMAVDSIENMRYPATVQAVEDDTAFLSVEWVETEHISPQTVRDIDAIINRSYPEYVIEPIYEDD